MALIIILIKAGLSLDLSDLKKVGRPAVMMSFVPACCEIVGYVTVSYTHLDSRKRDIYAVPRYDRGQDLALYLAPPCFDPLLRPHPLP